jgi:hypothetical protein
MHVQGSISCLNRVGRLLMRSAGADASGHCTCDTSVLLGLRMSLSCCSSFQHFTPGSVGAAMQCILTDHHTSMACLDRQCCLSLYTILSQQHLLPGTAHLAPI